MGTVHTYGKFSHGGVVNVVRFPTKSNKGGGWTRRRILISRGEYISNGGGSGPMYLGTEHLEQAR